MDKKNNLSIKQRDTDSIIELIVDSIREIKGKNIAKLDLRGISGAPADFFIVCEGNSTVQVSSIANNVFKRLKQEKSSFPISFEGKQNSTWILIDYFNTVVHVFYPETREFYKLEAMWNDAIIENYDD